MVKYVLILLMPLFLTVAARAQQSAPSPEQKNAPVQKAVEATFDKKSPLPSVSAPLAKVQDGGTGVEKKAVGEKKLEEEKKKLPRDAITGKSVEPKPSAVKKETLRDSVRKKIKDKKNPAN